MKKKLKKQYHKRPIVVLVVLALFVLFGWLAFSVLTKPELTYPLGSSFEYIGKNDYGCNGFCASEPSSTYYYGTDMNTTEVIASFKKTRVIQQPREANGVTDFILTNIETNQDILIYYHTNKADLYKQYEFSPSNKKYIISMPSFDYQLAKDSL